MTTTIHNKKVTLADYVSNKMINGYIACSDRISPERKFKIKSVSPDFWVTPAHSSVEYICKPETEVEIIVAKRKRRNCEND